MTMGGRFGWQREETIAVLHPRNGYKLVERRLWTTAGASHRAAVGRYGDATRSEPSLTDSIHKLIGREKWQSVIVRGGGPSIGRFSDII